MHDSRGRIDSPVVCGVHHVGVAELPYIADRGQQLLNEVVDALQRFAIAIGDAPNPDTVQHCNNFHAAMTNMSEQEEEGDSLHTTASAHKMATTEKEVGESKLEAASLTKKARPERMVVTDGGLLRCALHAFDRCVVLLHS